MKHHLKRLTLAEISRLINGQLVGDGDIQISGLARLDEAQAEDLSFIASPKYAKYIAQTGAAALIVYPDFPQTDKPVIKVAEPYTAFLKIAAFMQPRREPLPTGIHSTAVIGKGTIVGDDSYIGPYVVIGQDCCIGKSVKIHPGTVISDGVSIDDDTIIYQNVSIREECHIGKRVILHPGVVIGADGFGFQNIDGINQKIPQLGIVIIEDDVEIGANSCIDRATIGATRIGKGTKLDNLIQVGHNVVIGEQTVIAAQTGISGSCTIGNGVMIAGQVGIADHVTVADQAILGAQAGVTKNVPPKTVVSGYPAREHFRAKREEAVIRRLPEIFRQLKKLEEKVIQLESNP